MWGWSPVICGLLHKACLQLERQSAVLPWNGLSDPPCQPVFPLALHVLQNGQHAQDADTMIPCKLTKRRSQGQILHDTKHVLPTVFICLYTSVVAQELNFAHHPLLCV